MQLQRQLLLAELAHQLGLVLDQDDLALADDADAVGHLLGLVDVVRGQDDGHAAVAQRAHQLPHVAPQLDVDAGGRLVEEQDAAARATAPWRSAARRFMPPDSVMILLSFLSHSDRSRSTFSMCAGLGGLPNRPRLNDTVAHTRLEGVGGQLLRHQADHRARGAVVARRCRGRRPARVPAAGVDDAADDADQRGLAGAVGAEQREDLAAADLEVDVLQRLEARRVGLGKAC